VPVIWGRLPGDGVIDDGVASFALSAGNRLLDGPARHPRVGDQ